MEDPGIEKRRQQVVRLGAVRCGLLAETKGNRRDGEGEEELHVGARRDEVGDSNAVLVLDTGTIHLNTSQNEETAPQANENPPRSMLVTGKLG